MSIGPTAGPSGDIEMSIVEYPLPVKKPKKESCCTQQCIGKTFVKVTIPSLIIGGLIAGAIFYGVTRLEAVLKDQIAFAVSELSGDLQNQITSIIDTFNSIITAQGTEISSATSATLNEGVRLLNNSIQTSIQGLSKNLTEAIANATQKIP